MDKEIRIRRYQDNLVTIGTGILLLSLWTVLKTVLLAVLPSGNLPDSIDTSAASVSAANGQSLIIFMILTLAISLFLDLFLRIYTGISARAVGYGRKKKKGYLVTAAVLIILHIFNSFYLISSCITFPDQVSVIETAVTAIIDTTSVIMLIELIRSAIMLKVLTERSGVQRS